MAVPEERQSDMNENLIHLIESNGLTLHGDIEFFAHLVAAAEREECARVCDDEALRCEAAVQRAEPDEVSAIRSTAWKISVCAAAIRARGNT